MKKQGKPSWISMAGIFIGFEFMAVIDILNKTEHKNNITKWKCGLCKVKLSICP